MRSHSTARSLCTDVWPWVGWLLVASACSSNGPSRDSWIHLQLQPAPALFQATVAWANGEIETLACPAAGPHATMNAKCTDGGLDVMGRAGGFEVTLRSTGNVFSTTTVAAQTDSTTTIALQALPPSTNTIDYATRLDGDTCLDTLLQYAVPVPTDVGNSYSVKIYMRDLKTLPKVYFLNTALHPLHFDFARSTLGLPLTAEEFNDETYVGTDHSAIAGTLVFYPAVAGSAQGSTPLVEAPWTLGFFASDRIAPEEIRLAHRLVEERLTCLQWSGPARRLVYLPAGTTQEQEASVDARAFERRGIGWMTQPNLFGAITQQALNPGLAFGTLKRMTPEQLATSVVSFRDVLLLTRIPNELPIVGGTITEEFQTPLAHVNVAARTRGTPNLAYPKAFQDPNVSSLVGKLVRFEVADGSFTLREATLAEAEVFWQSRSREPYVPVFDSSVVGIPSFDQIGFADSVRVGVKAANLAELSHILGENAPAKGLAIPFHYYQEFMDSSRTSEGLCDAAQADCTTAGRDAAACMAARARCWLGAAESFAGFVTRMLDDASFKQDTALRDAILGNLRSFIERTDVAPTFAVLLDGRVAEVFQTAKVKIRSSTNCEDLPNFSGAGLYNSYGAHATGADAASKVVVKVFASVWSFRGFEERSFWNIDHKTVRMGCVINEAFVAEAANGVLITSNIADPAVEGMYVNVQKGEESVTNPTKGALPEIFTIIDRTGGQVARQRFSSLSPNKPLLSDSEINTLYDAADKARAHFTELYGMAPGQLVLDMEFKLTPDRTIVFKQARPYSASP